MNNTAKDIIRHTLSAAFGLFLFGFGVYLTIQANIGAAPWDAFNLGLSETLGIKYGTASIIVSFVIVGVDILLRERIGIGMLLDAVVVGKSVDLFNAITLVPTHHRLAFSLMTLTAGIFIMGFSQYIYMKAALGCGPRDSMLVGLKRRSSRIPIGLISVMILTTVTVFGWLLGGPVGIGTLLCALLIGPVMQLVFRLVGFDPERVEHQDIISSLRIILNKH